MIDTYEEIDHIKPILMNLEKSILVETLLTLAMESSSAAMLVRTIASTVNEKIALFKENIDSITHQGRHSSLSGEMILDLLTRSLQMLDPLEIEPKLGLTLMASFYETDSWALESTTELDWDFEVVFTHRGFEKFVEFASRCDDTDFIVDIIKKLLVDDDYSMRSNLFEEASSFLSEEGLKKLQGEAE